MRNQKGGKLRIALDHSSMYGSMPCIPCLCQRTYYWAKGDKKGRRWWKSSFRVRNDVGLGGARTSDPIRSPLELPPLKPLFSWGSPSWFAPRVSLREEEDAWRWGGWGEERRCEERNLGSYSLGLRDPPRTTTVLYLLYCTLYLTLYTFYHPIHFHW